MKRHFFYIFFYIIFFVLTGCTSLFFQPQQGLFENPFVKKVSCEDIYFEAPDGVKLHGWLLEPEGKSLGRILFLHGNAENISTHVNSVLWLVLKGYTVFAFDYRGYGLSEGNPTLEGVHIDTEAAFKKLMSLYPDERIVVLGQSLGGAIAIYMVANSSLKKDIKALISEGSFASYRQIAREKLGQFFLTWPFQYPLSLLFNDSYSPVRYIDKVSPVPLVILHGDMDRIVPVHHGEILYKKAFEPKEFWLAKDLGHIESFKDEGIRERLVEYLKSLK